jgi:vacuolar iron transporter family protein
MRKTMNDVAPTRKSHPRSEHLGKHGQYWRDIILGVNDGLVSTFLLVAGVTGGGLSSQNILLTAISGAVAGAISMCAGEYVATKSQNEVMRGELALERIHIAENFDAELEELDSELLSLIGITTSEGELRQEIKTYYQNNPNALFQLMAALEFGVIDTEERSPVRAGMTSCFLFAGGAVPSVIPFAFSKDNPTNGLIAAAALTSFCLFTVGAIKTWATRTSCTTAAMENLVIATFGGGIAYAVGLLFERAVRE